MSMIIGSPLANLVGQEEKEGSGKVLVDLYLEEEGNPPFTRRIEFWRPSQKYSCTGDAFHTFDGESRI